MLEYQKPVSKPIRADVNNVDTMYQFARDIPDHIVYDVPRPGGGWRPVTAREFARTVTDLAKGLIASGIEPGDRVALMAPTSYEWTCLDFAIWAAGGVVVAIYDSSSTEQAAWILADSGSRFLVIYSAEHQAVIDGITPERIPDLRETLQIEGGALAELLSRGREIDDEVVHTRRAMAGRDDPANVIYTSGTTGRPKGVVLTHGNLWAQRVTIRAELAGVITDGRVLMFLPLAHVFAHAGELTTFDAHTRVAHTSDWSTLIEQFAQYRPTFVIGVPRVMEKLFNATQQKAHSEGKLAGWMFDRAVDTALAYSIALEDGAPSQTLQLRHAIFDKLIYRKIRAALGGQCSAAIIGGGPLAPRLTHFFRGAGITVYEGYGLTETTAGITVNSPDHIKIGTVGQPTQGSSIRIASDGEILLKGDVVFDRYWNDPEATAAAFQDGWFASGDLGTLDEEGYLTVTGRKKEIIVTAGGKNVSPAILEDSLRSHPLISQVMAVGDGRPFVGALLTLDPDSVAAWAGRHNLPADTPMEQLVENADLVAEINAAVAQTNILVSHAEQIKKIRILPVDWTQETGELTPKMSLKRAVVHKRFAAEIEKLYA